MVKRAEGGLWLRWLLALALRSRVACRAVSQGGSEAGMCGGGPNDDARGETKKGF